MNRRKFIKSGALFLPAFSIFVPRLIRAQSILTAEGLAAYVPPAAGGGGGGITLLGSGVIAGSTDENTVTTGPYNTTTAKLIVIAEATTFGAVTPTDSKSNTWTQIIGEPSFGSAYCSLWYCLNPTTDAAHTFSASTVNTHPTLGVFAFTGLVSGALDQHNGSFNASGGATTVSTGAITPSGDGYLIVANASYDSGTSSSWDSGLGGALNKGWIIFQNTGLGVAFKAQSVAASINATCTLGGSSQACAAIASFVK